MEEALISGFSDNCRGLGVVQMAKVMESGAPLHPANGRRGLHVLEMMDAIVRSSRENREIELESRL